MISLLCPTRNRPAELRRMIDSARETAQYNVEVVCYVDRDDESYEAEKEVFPYCKRAKFIVGPRITLSECWNICAGRATGDLLMMANDDVLFRTNKWDVLIEKEFEQCPDRILMVHGSPGDKPEYCGFAAHPVVHRKWVDTLGYMTWPFFTGDYADTFIDWVARELGRAKCLPYALEHLHPYHGKGQDDQTYRDRAAFHVKDNPAQLWDKSLPDRLAAVEKLRAVMR